jgi:hypothetical protein
MEGLIRVASLMPTQTGHLVLADIHGQGEMSVFRIMEARRPARLTLALQFDPALAWNTVTLDEIGDGRKATAPA